MESVGTKPTWVNDWLVDWLTYAAFSLPQVAVLASLLFGERLGMAGVAGLLLGVAGLLMLELPEQYFTTVAAFAAASSDAFAAPGACVGCQPGPRWLRAAHAALEGAAQ
jgi:hypothetical protein